MPAASKDVDTNEAAGFPTWDSMVADAQSQVAAIKPYKLPLGDVELVGADGETTIEENVVLTIPCPDGVNYLTIVSGQRTGDSPRILNAMVPDSKDRAKLIAKMAGVPFPIVDVLSSTVLRHYYGLSIEVEEKAGNSPAS